MLSFKCGGRRGRERIVVGFTTTYAISAYHHWCCEFESRSRRGVQHYAIKFVRDLRKVGGFLRVLRCPPRYNWNIVESGFKHHNPLRKIYHIYHEVYDCSIIREGVRLKNELPYSILKINRSTSYRHTPDKHPEKKSGTNIKLITIIIFDFTCYRINQ